MHEGPTEPAICLERPTLANLPALALPAGVGIACRRWYPWSLTMNGMKVIA